MVRTKEEWLTLPWSEREIGKYGQAASGKRLHELLDEPLSYWGKESADAIMYYADAIDGWKATKSPKFKQYVYDSYVVLYRYVSAMGIADHDFEDKWQNANMASTDVTKFALPEGAVDWSFEERRAYEEGLSVEQYRERINQSLSKFFGKSATKKDVFRAFFGNMRK